MWQAQIGDRMWTSKPTPGTWRAGRWALLAAVAVLALPILALVLLAVLVGVTVFVLMALLSAILATINHWVARLRGSDRSGRQNVRVIRRDF